jgi:predicted nucleic acid-binding protein
MTKALVLDANILVRAALGRRVMAILETYSDRIHFLTPETSYHDVLAHLPGILAKRRLCEETVKRLVEDEILALLPGLVTPISSEVYADGESEARRRLAGRDEADWPFVALALLLNCPIWTEDRDFFGSGVAAWTTDRVEIYLQAGE